MKIKGIISSCGKFLFTGLFFCLLQQPVCADAWADFHGNTDTTGLDSNTRYNPYSTLAPPLKLLWSRTNLKLNNSYGCVVSSSPVVANGIVYLGGANGISDMDAFYAFNTDTGADIAGFGMVTNDILTSPVLAYGNVYVAYGQGFINAYNAATGAQVTGFPVQTDDHIGSTDCSPVVADGIIYYGSHGWVYAWDAATGAVIAGFPVQIDYTGEFTTLTVSKGVLYCPIPGGGSICYLHARDAKTGVPLPGFTNVGLGYGYPMPEIYNGTIFFGSSGCGNTRLMAVDALTGSNVLWSPMQIDTLCNNYTTAAAIANGVIYFGGSNAKFYAVDAATGAIKPGFPAVLSGSIYSTPAVANGYAYIGDSTNTVYAIDISNGSIAWQYSVPKIDPYHVTGGIGLCSAAIAENKLFISSLQGAGLYVFDFDPDPTPTLTPPPTLTKTPTIPATPTLTTTLSLTQTRTATLSMTPTCTLTPTVTATPTATMPPFCLEMEGVFPNPAVYEANIVYNICRDSAITAVIYTVSGERFCTLRQNGMRGHNKLCWKLKNDKNTASASGIFVFSLEAESSSEKRKIWGKISIIK